MPIMAVNSGWVNGDSTPRRMNAVTTPPVPASPKPWSANARPK